VMRAALLIALLCVASQAVTLTVTLNVFSGAEDPTFEVAGADAESLLTMLGEPTGRGTVRRPIPWYRMGYAGFVVTAGPRTWEVYDSPMLEMNLLSLAARTNLPQTVAEHVTSEISRVMKLKNSTAEAPVFRGGDNCSPPVRGPNNGTKYDPQTDCNGCFITRVGENNCYNYGNDVLTNSFAQPGRGSGQKWKSNTCDDMHAAAERDGLKWAGTTLPSKQADVGHYVSLHIWPGTNFHWIRRDSIPDGFWSHKPGGTAVRNVDNQNRKIQDPSKADFAPWTQFCGYMVSVPSTVNIN